MLVGVCVCVCVCVIARAPSILPVWSLKYVFQTLRAPQGMI